MSICLISYLVNNSHEVTLAAEPECGRRQGQRAVAGDCPDDTPMAYRKNW